MELKPDQLPVQVCINQCIGSQMEKQLRFLQVLTQLFSLPYISHPSSAGASTALAEVQGELSLVSMAPGSLSKLAQPLTVTGDPSIVPPQLGEALRHCFG